MPKTCQNCHDLKSLKKELQKSYDNFQRLHEHKSSMEDGYISQIEQLVEESEIQVKAIDRLNTQLYRLKCENESLANQLSSQPGLATVKRYRDDMISAVKEKVHWVQQTAAEARRRSDAEKKIKELEVALDQMRERLDYCLMNGGVSEFNMD